MQRQARLPEIFDQIGHFTPEVEFVLSAGGRGVKWNFLLISDLTYFTSPPPPEVKFGLGVGGLGVCGD